MNNNLILPNFLIIGAHKAGTSFVHELLAQYPEIHTPSVKEIHFFDIDSNFKMGASWYSEFFNSAQSNELIFESTPGYFYNPKVPARINNMLGSAVKFILLLRDPVERAISHYNMSYQKGYHTSYDFHKGFIDSLNIAGGYSNAGFYFRHLTRYLEFFDIEQFLFLDFETLKTNVNLLVMEVGQFLGIDRMTMTLDKGVYRNTTHYPRFRSLNRFINSEHWLMSLIRNILSPSNKKEIRRLILDLNKSKKSKFPSISFEEKKSLYLKYYKEDYLKLTEICHKKFKWHNTYCET